MDDPFEEGLRNMPRYSRRMPKGALGDYWKHDRKRPRAPWWMRIFGWFRL